MNRFLPFLFLLLLVSLFGCKKETTTNESNIEQEINPAKSYYAANGGSFVYRLYTYPPTEGDNANYNNHVAEIYKIIEDNGKVSLIAKNIVWTINLTSYSAVLNIEGDYNKPETTTSVGIQNDNANDDFELLDGTRLVSYHFSAGAHGSYGFANTIVYVHNPVYFQGAISASANQGYMNTLFDSNFMLSMGYNSNYGHPTLYRYIPNTASWNGTIIPSMDFVDGSGVNVPTTNDASKVGNHDKVFWTWLSYTNTVENGKISLISFDGSSFSSITSLDGIGSIMNGGWNNQHTVRLYKNPNNLNNPYLVVRRFNTDILDIYKFTGSTIERIKTGLTLPSGINPDPTSQLRLYRDLAFFGNDVYLITGFDKNLYKLNGNTFELYKTSLTQTGETISAMESGAAGIYLSIVKNIASSPEPKTVSDVVLIGD